MCHFDFQIPYLSDIVSFLKGALNSDFGIAATGSFFGAVGGYFIVLVTNNRAEILSKIERLKIAIALTHSLFNVAYSINKQHIFELHEEYQQGRLGFVAAQTNHPKIHSILFNIKTISFPYIDFDLISSKLLKETGFTSRAVILATTLIRCLYELRELLKQRHIVINEINSIAVDHKFDIAKKACLYYGINIKTPTGDFLYTNYFDVMNNIKDFTLDCIWLSRELAWELLENAKTLSKKIYYNRPKVGSVDYSDVDKKYLPNDDNYKNWRDKIKKA